MWNFFYDRSLVILLGFGPFVILFLAAGVIAAWEQVKQFMENN